MFIHIKMFHYSSLIVFCIMYLLRQNNLIKGFEMTKYVSIQDLDLSSATVVGFDCCNVKLVGSELVCSDLLGRVVVKFPFDVNARFAFYRGLPGEIGISEDGGFEVFDIDYDDEDFFEDEEQPDFILEGYSYLSTMNFTIIIKN